MVVSIRYGYFPVFELIKDSVAILEQFYGIRTLRVSRFKIHLGE